MKRITLYLLIALSAAVPAAAADYTLDVRLNPAAKTVGGSLLLEWTNDTPFPAPDLRFHLYFNAWENEKTSFMNSWRWRDRDLSDWGEGDWGGTEISSLVVARSLPAGEEGVPRREDFDLTGRMEFIQPDDGNPNDRSVLRVALPQPVAPGESIRVEIEFTTKIPRTFARTGFRGDYYFLAHWFPKLGVFEEDGSWNCHQFIQTEFYSRFGDYDVKLQVPSGWTLGATGTAQSVNDNGDGTSTHHYTQQRVHGFAWVTSPRLREHLRRFQHESLPPVQMRLLIMPDHAGQEDRYFAATEAALRYYGEWFGAYPYDHVTVVDPAWESGSGGMEYPTLFTGGSRWLTPLGSDRPESVTVHEMGHQFWYGVVGNNEFEHAWLDEGLNSYSQLRTQMVAYPEVYRTRRYFKGFIPLLFRGLPRERRTVAGESEELEKDIMGRPSWKLGPDAYGINSYTKPALMLLTLERYLGWDRFQKAMAAFYRQYSFGHPVAEDFFRVLGEETGEDLSWFWEQTYYSSNVFDYGVSQVGRDRLDRPFVVVRRFGEATFPVTARITFEDGTSVQEEWDGQGRWQDYVYQPEQRIVRVEVDPEEVVALDVDRTNNSWVEDAPSAFAAKKWALKWMVWMQNVMETYAFHF
ncbi:MAG TPA: M1 family metallopeptidase [Acidobacteriota bacterium]|nr:M1 family metallopeptidase [Acidobacteriota bacterium]